MAVGTYSAYPLASCCSDLVARDGRGRRRLRALQGPRRRPFACTINAPSVYANSVRVNPPGCESNGTNLAKIAATRRQTVIRRIVSSGFTRVEIRAQNGCGSFILFSLFPPTVVVKRFYDVGFRTAVVVLARGVCIHG